ncbi:Transmembrane domain-containing protein [Spironucleus salmonicida]|uniref:Transmembrane domain-containing protein n=1 Tax=Spironucleus salmonicida TaxID=348837 RepID=V6LX87_9EUKA|nr:Transmembrane domain-containing protein [Spironucleus salmonicida]|eukprot:EST49242.1 Transmembrane domain-containing protein [Spironucleus salmonicida]
MTNNIFIDSLPNLIPTIGTFLIGVIIGCVKLFPENLLPMVYNFIYSGLYPIILLNTNSWIGITIIDWKLIGIWFVHSVVMLLLYWLYPKRFFGPILLADSNSIFIPLTNKFHYISRLGAFILLPLYYYLYQPPVKVVEPPHVDGNQEVHHEEQFVDQLTITKDSEAQVIIAQHKVQNSYNKQVLIIVLHPLFIMTIVTLLLSLIPGIRPAFPYAIQGSFKLLQELPEPLGFVCAGIAFFFAVKKFSKQALKDTLLQSSKTLILLGFKQFLLPYIYGLIALHIGVQDLDVQEFRRTLSFGPGTLVFIFDQSIDSIFALVIGQIITYFAWVIW